MSKESNDNEPIWTVEERELIALQAHNDYTVALSVVNGFKGGLPVDSLVNGLGLTIAKFCVEIGMDVSVFNDCVSTYASQILAKRKAASETIRNGASLN